jgi:hypothetical protein
MISIRLFIPILVQVRISSGVRIARSDCCVCSFFCSLLFVPLSFCLVAIGLSAFIITPLISPRHI